MIAILYDYRTKVQGLVYPYLHLCHFPDPGVSTLIIILSKSSLQGQMKRNFSHLPAIFRTLTKAILRFSNGHNFDDAYKITLNT